MLKYLAYTFITLSLASTVVVSQEKLSQIQIEVRDQESSDQLIGVNVYVSEIDRYYVTDANGQLVLNVPKSGFEIELSYIGYETQKIFVDGSKKRIVVSLASNFTQLSEVVVTSERADNNVASTDMGKSLISIETIRDLPPLAGEIDVIKSMVLLPGVSSVGEASSGLNVRGGSFDQNLILLGDGIIYNPSHLFGFFSSINPDFIDNVTLYKGNIPAKYGGRASSVVDIQYLNGNYSKWKGDVGLGMVSSKATFSGPLLKDKLSLAVGGRISYVNWLLSIVDEPGIRNSSADFYDVNAKVDYRLNDNNKISYAVYKSYDEFNLASDTTNQWSNFSQVLKWNHIFSEKLYMNWSVADSKYDFSILNNTGFNDFELDSNIEDLSSTLNLNLALNKQLDFEFGGEYKLMKINPGSLSLEENSDDQVPLDVEDEQGALASVYVQGNYEIGKKISLSLGGRYNKYDYIGGKSVNQYADFAPRNESTVTNTVTYGEGETIKSYENFTPRIGLRYSFNKSTSIKLGVNKLVQYIQLVSNTATPSPVNIWKLSDEFVAPQEVIQYSVGIFKNLKDNNIETSLEVYYKDIDNVLEYKDGADLILTNNVETELLSGKGKAYGVEFLIRKKVGDWSGWASYTYSRTLRKVEGAFPQTTVNNAEWYPSNYDKPHDLTFVLNRQFSITSKLSLVFTYSTGRPVTYPSQKFQYFGQDLAYFDSRNQSRIPDYHRLDISYSFKFKSNISLLAGQWTLGVYNLYGRANAYSVYFDDVEGAPPGAFKLSVLTTPIPSLSYNIKF